MKTYKNYSLVEILTVIVIGLILITLVLPAFFNMTKGQSVELATREVGSKLKAVRTYAISQRKYAALVFITSEETTNNDRYCYKSYRACVVNSANEFVSWVPDEKWEFLPVGTIVQNITNDQNKQFDGVTEIEAIAGIDTAVFAGPENLFLKGVCFKPTGESSGNTLHIYVGEGTDPQHRQNKEDRAVIEIDQYTGRISYGKE